LVFGMNLEQRRKARGQKTKQVVPTWVWDPTRTREVEGGPLSPKLGRDMP
jgi:hypothetical protein